MLAGEVLVVVTILGYTVWKIVKKG